MNSLIVRVNVRTFRDL